jgi:hypothetical protein
MLTARAHAAALELARELWTPPPAVTLRRREATALPAGEKCARASGASYAGLARNAHGGKEQGSRREHRQGRPPEALET